MALKIGRSVKVRKGILCPDDPEFDLSGWQGRIIEISEDENGEIIIGIAWDSLTLKDMPERYIEKSEADGLDWSVMYMLFSEVEQVDARDLETDADSIKAELYNRFQWTGLGDDGERIQAVVNSVETDDELELMKAWEKHLKQNLHFPFKGIVNEFQSRGPIKYRDRLKVFDIKMIDDLYGIIVSCQKGLKRYDFPLADLAAVDEKSDNARHIQDYRTWFANR